MKQGYLFPVSDDFAAKLQRTFPQLDLLLTPGVGTVIDTVRPKGRFDLEALEAAVAARRLRIAPEVLANVLAALLGGKHVILTGPPGTAKTTLAELVASVASRRRPVHRLHADDSDRGLDDLRDDRRPGPTRRRVSHSTKATSSKRSGDDSGSSSMS